MGVHTETLWRLANQLYLEVMVAEIRELTQTDPFDYVWLETFDRRLGGPCISMLTGKDRHGRYASEDREIFRPLQYCAMYLEHSHRELLARATVHMSGLHLESLLKRIGQIGRIPLGQAIGHQLIRHKLDPITLEQMKGFKDIYNAAKHDVDQSKDTHLFSVADAVLAYLIARQLGMRLYPLITLGTTWNH